MTIDNKLTISDHVLTLVKSSAKKLGILFTSVHRLILYKAFVRPIMDYCSHLFTNISNNHFNMLESIQKRGIKFIGDLQLTNNLQPLQHRRNISSLSLFFRYFHGMCSTELGMIIPNCITETHASHIYSNLNPHRIRKPCYRLSSFKNSFIESTATLWNSLPKSTF
jgi:hypothetical protein